MSRHIVARGPQGSRGASRLHERSDPTCRFDTLLETTTMTLAAEHELSHIGETSGCRDHDHDLIHELSRRLDALWRYDQYIANAEWRDELRAFWQDCKATEKQAIQRLRKLIRQEVANDCF